MNLDATPHKQGYLNTVIQRLRGRCQRTAAITWFMVTLSVCCLLLEAIGDPVRAALRYERMAVLQQHEWWRLITGHLVHASWRHALLNVAGLWVMGGLFAGCHSACQWLLIALLATASIDAGFLLLMPQLDWYVGLSGVLHGVLAAGMVCWWRREPPWLAAMLTVVVVGKLGWEQWQGALPLAGELPVIVNAHLYGALGGLLAALMLWWTGARLSSPAAV